MDILTVRGTTGRAIIRWPAPRRRVRPANRRPPSPSSRRLCDLARVARLVRVVARHGLAHLVASRLPARLGRRWRVLPAPVRLRRVFEELGGTFLKFGQLLALQPDILSLATCNALMDLLDRVPPFGVDAVERVFEADLGRRPQDVFDRFDPLPLATASVGQVHRAERAGRQLAVKVRRPRVEEEFASDLRLMLGFVRWVKRLRIRSLDWSIEPIEEFAAWSREEIDYRYETRYMQRLRANSADNPAEHVPEVVPELSTSRILTVEYLDGITVLGYLRAVERGDEVAIARLRQGGYDPPTFARNVIANFLGDAFRHGMFHADLHPANLMILPGNVVGYIDFGITGVLSRHSRRHLIAMTLAYTRGDLDSMCDAFFEVSALGPGSDPAGFRRGIHRLSQTWYSGDGAGRRLTKNFTLVMLDMLRLSRATRILPERSVVKYIRSAIAIDGLITRFCPGFDVGGYLAEVCERSLRLEARQALFERERLLGIATAGSSLAYDGLLRAAAALDRYSRAGGPTVSVPPVASAAESPRALALAVFAAVLAVLITLTGDGATLGWNLFTAEAALAAVSLLLLIRSTHRWTNTEEARHA